MEPPTLEELVEKIGITQDELEQTCSDEQLNSISLFLDWRNVAPHLGLSKIDIKDIESEKRMESERRLEALQKWKTKYGFKATLKRLVVTLLTVENASDAERVCRLLQSCTETGECSGAATVVVSKSQVQPLECSIDEEIKELEDQFLYIVDKAAKCLKKSQLSDLKRCVTQLPVSVKYQHIRFLEQKLSAISNAQSVGALFAILGLYWDFLNYGLLHEVIQKFGNRQTKKLIESYTQKLRQFRMNTKLGDFIDKWAGRIPPNFSEFITEMRGDWRDRTLEELEEFRRELARSLYMEDYSMRFMSAGTGSIAVTWALQSSLPAIADSLQSAIQLLEKKYGVLRVIFQGSNHEALEIQKHQGSPTVATKSDVTSSYQQVDLEVVKQWMKSGKKELNMVTIGKVGAGKSSLLNALIGDEVGDVGHGIAECLTIERHGIKINIFDTPGFSDLKTQYATVLAELLPKRKGEIDIFLFCLNMNDRVDSAITEMGQICERSFGGKSFWEKTIFVLTHANKFDIPRRRFLKGKPPEEEEKKQEYMSRILEFREALIERFGDSVSSVPVVPAGYDPADVPDHDDWLTTLWKHVFERMNRDVQSAFVQFNKHRFTEVPIVPSADGSEYIHVPASQQKISTSLLLTITETISKALNYDISPTLADAVEFIFGINIHTKFAMQKNL